MGSRAEQGSSISSTPGSVAMARAMHRRCCCPPESERPLSLSLSLTSSHSAAARRDFLDAAGLVALVAVEAQAEGDVVIDAGGEWVWLLEDHADEAPHGDGVDVGGVDVLAAIVHVAFEAEATNEIVHPVEAAQNSAFAAARGADEGRDRVLLYRDGCIADCLEVAVEEFLDVDVDSDVVLGGLFLPGCPRGGAIQRFIGISGIGHRSSTPIA